MAKARTREIAVSRLIGNEVRQCVHRLITKLEKGQEREMRDAHKQQVLLQKQHERARQIQLAQHAPTV